MKISMHRRRNQSLPPRPARSRKLLVIIALFLSATVALAAKLSRAAEPPPGRQAVVLADRDTQQLIDERMREHLRALSR
jgi:hypothetical protein